jgi:hypothetical protein
VRGVYRSKLDVYQSKQRLTPLRADCQLASGRILATTAVSIVPSTSTQRDGSVQRWIAREGCRASAKSRSKVGWRAAFRLAAGDEGRERLEALGLERRGCEVAQALGDDALGRV